MKKSESIANLAKALSQAQGEMGGAVKGTANPFFKSVYADLSSVIEAIRGPLSRHGLAYIQATEPSESHEVRIETMLMHESGEWLSSILAIPVSKHDAQGFGSAITYAKRYSLQALMGTPSEDDDGNAASKAAPAKAAPAKAAPAKAPVSEPTKAAQDYATTHPEDFAFLQKIAMELVDAIESAGDQVGAFDLLESAKLDNKQKQALWGILKPNSKTRAAITAESAKRAATAEQGAAT